MKSLYLAIVLAMVVILALSVVVFLAITKSMEDSYFNPIFDDMDEVSVQEAAEMLQTTGPDAVTTYMHRLDSVFGGVHYLLDADGNDVVSGQSHAELLPQAPLTKFRGEKDGRRIIAHRSSDGRYWFVVTVSAETKDTTALPLLSSRGWRQYSAVLACGRIRGLAYPENCRRHRSLWGRRFVCSTSDAPQ